MLTDKIIKKALPKLIIYARHLYYNPTKADDLVGATLLRAWSKKHLLKIDNNPLLWLKGIMYSVFCNQLKYDKLRDTFVLLEEDMYRTKASQEDYILCKELIHIIKTKSCNEAAKELGCCKATAWHRRNWINEEF